MSRTGFESGTAAHTGTEAGVTRTAYVDVYWDEYFDVYGADAATDVEAAATHKTGLEGS